MEIELKKVKEIAKIIQEVNPEMSDLLAYSYGFDYYIYHGVLRLPVYYNQPNGTVDVTTLKDMNETPGIRYYVRYEV